MHWSLVMVLVMAIPFHLDHCVLPDEAGEVNLGDLLLENRGELRKVHVRDLRLSQVLGKVLAALPLDQLLHRIVLLLLMLVICKVLSNRYYTAGVLV